MGWIDCRGMRRAWERIVELASAAGDETLAAKAREALRTLDEP